MTKLKYLWVAAASTALLFLSLSSCNESSRKKVPENFTYNQFKDSIKQGEYDSTVDISNIFDSTLFTPGVDSLDTLLASMDTMWRGELSRMVQIDTLFKLWKNENKYTQEEMEVIQENIKVLDSFLARKNLQEEEPCKQKDCLVYAEIIKSTQMLYLYLDGELVDSFKVSTGIARYETPELDRRPSGPIFTKYTSRKFPGGNYNGLGNMPYAVFIRGGYAIHGTTKGNFDKLGTKASHGCIRLHPLNAKIFNELVKKLGIEYTWITIKDSLP